MVVVHHLNNSRSQRVLWLLEELGVPYEVKRYERDAKTMLAPPSLIAIHPLGKSPVIVDGEITMAESGAIIEYLVSKYGDGRLIPPAATAQRLRYTYWLHYAEGSAMSPLLLKLVFDRVAANPAPWPVSAIARRIAATVTNSFIAPNLKRHLDFIEAELSAQPWFAGEQFTAADVQMSFPLEIAVSRAGLNASRPK
jgi:glutathione S-transferase